MAVVFAQLVTGRRTSRQHGVHASWCRSATRTARPCPGVTIEDCGPKAGLNGVDNGRLTFDHVRVPRDQPAQPLRRRRRGRHVHAARSRTRPGASSPCSARWCAAGSASPAAPGAATRTALAIAIRYADVRRQFAAPGSDDEVLLLDYLRAPAPAAAGAGDDLRAAFAQNELCRPMHDVQTAAAVRRRRRDEHAPARARGAGRGHQGRWAPGTPPAPSRSAARPAAARATWRRTGCPQLKADTDVFTTFEGDNTVLLQLVAKGLLTSYRDAFGDLDTLGTVRFVARQVASSRRRADGGPHLGHAAGRRPAAPSGGRRPARPRGASCRCWPIASSTCSRPRPPDARRRPSRGRTCSPCSTTPRTTCCWPPARTSSGWCPSRSPRRRRVPRPRRPRSARPAVHAAPAARARAGARLVRRARPAHGSAQPHGHRAGQRGLRAAAAARPRPRRRLRHPGRLARRPAAPPPP